MVTMTCDDMAAVDCCATLSPPPPRTSNPIIAVMRLPRNLSEEALEDRLVWPCCCLAHGVTAVQVSLGAPRPVSLAMRTNQSGHFKGVALLIYETLAQCHTAISTLDGLMVEGQAVCHVHCHMSHHTRLTSHHSW